MARGSIFKKWIVYCSVLRNLLCNLIAWCLPQIRGRQGTGSKTKRTLYCACKFCNTRKLWFSWKIPNDRNFTFPFSKPFSFNLICCFDPRIYNFDCSDNSRVYVISGYIACWYKAKAPLYRSMRTLTHHRTRSGIK